MSPTFSCQDRKRYLPSLPKESGAGHLYDFYTFLDAHVAFQSYCFIYGRMVCRKREEGAASPKLVKKIINNIDNRKQKIPI
jgi:NADH:ubiquinone oxidoreductase subunit D